MIRLGLVIAAIAVPLMPPLAEAAKCPSGQIYRVSKKTCQSKAIAIKLGIIKPARGSKAKAAKSKRNNTIVKAAIHTRVAQPVATPAPLPEITQSGNSAKSASPEPVSTKRTPDQTQAVATPNSTPVADPIAAIAAAAPAEQTKPMRTRMVKATYFTAAPGLPPATPRDSAIVKRAVLSLLKNRLLDHAERNRRMYMERAEKN